MKEFAQKANKPVQQAISTKNKSDTIKPKLTQHNNNNERSALWENRPSIAALIQRTAIRDPFSNNTIQKKGTRVPVPPPGRNNTGLSDNLKNGIQSLSGISMDSVRVHYNSSRPTQLNAHAYTQGTDIHVAPGQERHLPHEAWHVVQQAQGRVRPTIQMKGIGINDDTALEHEADVMGKRAASARVVQGKSIEYDIINSQPSFVSTSVQGMFKESIVGKKRTTDDTDKTEGIEEKQKYKKSELKTTIKHTTGYITLDGFQKKGQKTNHAVGKKIEAKLSAMDPVKGSATGTNWTWMQWLRRKYPKAGVIRGHLLNHDLGGFGMQENLYPISTLANQEHSSKVEQPVKKLLSAELEKNKKGEDTKLVNYMVEVTETTTNNPEEAAFVCKFGTKGEQETTIKIPSNLGTDKGGFGGGKKDNPLKDLQWYHGNRRGYTGEEEAKSLSKYKQDNKIEIDDTNDPKLLTQSINAISQKSTKESLTLIVETLKNKYFNFWQDWVKKEIFINEEVPGKDFEKKLINFISSTPFYSDNLGTLETKDIQMLIVDVLKEKLDEIVKSNPNRKNEIASFLEQLKEIKLKIGKKPKRSKSVDYTEPPD